ncbi:MAG: hypothetical protein IPO21_12515 [Bacteroidales bacterium]|nr:hypothetical protein [Bacteroidales bacterium]
MGYSSRYKSINDGLWPHVAGVFDGGESLKIYVDGLLEATTATTATAITPTGDFYIGQDGAAKYERNWIGQIDNVVLWNYPQNKTFVKDWQNKEFSGKEDGLVAYWNFNEGSGTVALEVAHEQNGTLTGDAAYVASTLTYSKTGLPQLSVPETGLPYSIVVTGATINTTNIPVGSYISFFDGAVCVGSALLNSTANTPVVTWKGDENLGVAGFTSGNTITAKIYTEWYSTIKIFDAELTFAQGNGTYGNGSFSVVSAKISTTIAPKLIFSEQLLNFNTVFVDETKTDTLIFTNSGNAILQIKDIKSSSAEITVSQTAFSLLPLQTDTLFVTFAPKAVNSYNTTLTFTTI